MNHLKRLKKNKILRTILKKLKYIGGTVLKTVLFLFVLQFFIGIKAYASEKNVGIWVVRYQLTSKENIDSVIKFATRNHINDLFVQVIGRGYSYYNSNLIPKSPKIYKEKFDPLEYICRKSEKTGINIHGWINLLFVWSKNKRPEKKRHIVNKHPEWFTVHKKGRSILNIDSKDLRKMGVSGKYLEPAHPEVKKYCHRIIKELAINYNLDGIHLDYIRYPGPMFGYSKRNRDHFKKINKYEPNRIQHKKKLKGGYNKNELNWIKYRQKEIDSLVYSIRKELSKREQELKLSAAVKPGIYKAKLYYLQNWQKWINNNWVDFVVPMNYYKQRSMFYRITNEIKRNNNKEKIWMGVGTYNQKVIETDRQVRLIKNSSFSGIIFFSYQSVRKKDIYIKKYGLN